MQIGKQHGSNEATCKQQQRTGLMCAPLKHALVRHAMTIRSIEQNHALARYKL